MSSSTSLVPYQQNQELSASGYTQRKQVTFSLSVAWNIFVRNPLSQVCDQTYRVLGVANSSFTQRWNRMPLDTPGHLYLGSIPVRGFFFDDSVTLTDPAGPGITAVLCMTEGFENHTRGYLLETVTPTEWIKMGVNFLQLETPDHEGVSTSIIIRGVRFIDEHIQRGGRVYVHCKAGMSRSALIVLCYLLTYHRHLFPNYDKAFEFMQVNRAQVWLEPSKIENAKQFIKQLDEVSHESTQ